MQQSVYDLKHKNYGTSVMMLLRYWGLDFISIEYYEYKREYTATRKSFELMQPFLRHCLTHGLSYGQKS